MTFKHKLSVRLALLKDALVVGALAALACEMPVVPPDPDPDPTIHLQISPKSVTLPTNGTSQLTAVALNSTGDTVDLSLSWTATGGSMTDTSTSARRHYGRYKAGSDTGKFKVVAHGNGNGGTATDTATITVIQPAVASVGVTPATVTLFAGTAVQLTASTMDSTGTQLSGRAIAWSSSNGTVASVSASGMVTALTQGAATITATSEGKGASATITVMIVPVASVAVSPATASIAAGQTVQLTATPKDSAGGALTGRSVSWTSSNTSVATVNGSGLVTAVVAGSATITATSEGRSGSAAITVQAVAVAVASVTVSPATASVQAKRTLQLTATPKDSAGTALTGRSVTWASSNTSVATVNGSGLVTTVVAGTATITATSEGKSGSAAITVTPIPVASVAVSPATASIAAGQTVQLTATPKDSAGGALTGRSVSWTSSNTLVAIVNGSGLVTGVVVGTATITATSEGKSGTSSVTVQVPLPLGLIPDPTLLPVGTGQAPNVAAYLALNVAGRPAGFSYNDPVTGVKVWKVTSSTTPTSNSGAGHDYGEGGNAVSRGWGPNHNTHTILMRGDGMSYYLVDFTRGVGFSNYRQLTAPPRRDICATFSSVAGTERILYVHTGSQLIRYNTQTMQTENTGNFPLSNNIYTWLHQDRNDVWFTGLLDDNQTVWAWNSQTNQYLTHNESWTNEPRMERNGRYIVLTGGSSPSTVKVWDLANNSFGPQQSMNYFSHLASLRGRWVAVDNNANAPPPLDRYQIVGGSLTRSSAVFNNSGGYETNNSGNWVQNDDALQWAYISGVDESSFSNLLAFRQGVGLVRADGSDARLLVHHYTHSPNYWDYAWGQPSPDGKVAIFNSNMYGSGRYDLFVAEVPLR